MCIRYQGIESTHQSLSLSSRTEKKPAEQQLSWLRIIITIISSINKQKDLRIIGYKTSKQHQILETNISTRIQPYLSDVFFHSSFAHHRIINTIQFTSQRKIRHQNIVRLSVSFDIALQISSKICVWTEKNRKKKNNNTTPNAISAKKKLRTCVSVYVCVCVRLVL